MNLWTLGLRGSSLRGWVETIPAVLLTPPSFSTTATTTPPQTFAQFTYCSTTHFAHNGCTQLTRKIKKHPNLRRRGPSWPPRLINTTSRATFFQYLPLPLLLPLPLPLLPQFYLESDRNFLHLATPKQNTKQLPPLDQHVTSRWLRVS